MTRAIPVTESAIDYGTSESAWNVGRVLSWAVGIVVGGGMLIAIFLPSLCRDREGPNRVKCASNLKQIGQAILLYSNENNGQYPPSLATLLTTEELVPEVFVCPDGSAEKAIAGTPAERVAIVAAAEANAPGHKDCVSYIYVGQKLTNDAAKDTTIVAYEPLIDHGGDGANVLFGDGHVEFIDHKSWVKVAGDAGIVIVDPRKR